jgi:hypothetical protein
LIFFDLLFRLCGLLVVISTTSTPDGRRGVLNLAAATHPAAAHDLPWFLTAPGESDVLLTFTTIMMIGAVLGVGVIFFWLHSLPERLGHKKLQFEIVAVLGLLSLFTHIHIFWVAALLLALVDFPDFQTPLKRMAGALEKLSGIEPPPDATVATDEARNEAETVRAEPDAAPASVPAPAGPQPQTGA